jgi:hypothetical protein
MKLNKFVEVTISEFLNEQQILKEYNSNDLFLSTYDTAIKYAYDNIDDVSEAFDAYEENPDNMYTSYSRDKYIELIALYVDKYNELKTQDLVTIYRLIKLNSINDLDINNIGKHWSFEENGVGAYGEQHPNRGMMQTGKSFILEGDVSPEYIDWIYGFSSFIWYGEDQWECALIKGTKVIINSINNKELEKPLTTFVGDN